MINNFSNSDKWFNDRNTEGFDAETLSVMNYALAEEIAEYESIDDVEDTLLKHYQEKVFNKYC